MAEISLARSAQESPELVECFRHEGEECPRCDGSGFRPRRHCAGCGEPSGRPSEGGRALMGPKNARGKDQPMWCLHCHPEFRFVDAVWSSLERMGNEPRYYPPQEDAVMTLSIDAIKLYDAPVVDSDSDEDLDKGVIHLPETLVPWDEKAQKNVYLAGHRVGRPDTTGRMIFYNLDKLKSGDSVVLIDVSDNIYEYQVSEVFVVDSDAEWAIDPVRDRDMVTLQTCTYPTYKNRIIVRADRV